MSRISVFLAALAALVVIASPGSAAPVGNLESWGTYGLGQGQYANATMFGVDPSDGSVYVGDMTEKVGGGEGVRESFRIQKFSANGTFQASVLIPRFYDAPGTEELVTLFGVAVDPGLHRFYLLEGAKDPTTNEPYGARILVFSTTPEGNKLVPPSGGPTSLPLPTAGAERILNPTSIAVDPRNHEVEVFGQAFETEVPSSSRVSVIQRVTSSGAAGPRFTDTAKKLTPALESAKVITVAPNGTTYALTGRATKATRTKAWELPENLSEIKEVPGVSAAATAEEWTFGLEEKASTFTAGPELAVSPDGETLYWKERIEAWSPPSAGGNYLIHGFSLKSKATTVDYGGATSGSCKISSADAMFGVSGEGAGEKVVVLDPGQPNEEEQQAPNFGGKVLTFGRGGSGCPVATAKFTARVEGTTVAFDASSSELTSGPTATKGFVKEAIWKFGDGTEKTLTSSGSTEAPLTTSHTYATNGTFNATLQLRFKQPTYGNPPIVEHAVVVGTAEEFTLKTTKEGSGAITSTPGGINCGVTCEAKFAGGTLVKLTGTPETGFKAPTWTGCDAVTAGVCEVTMSAAKNVKATFLHEPVPLTVDKEGTGSGTVTSSPAGIDCGATCAARYEFEAEVTLTAVSESGTAPVLWTGCDSEPDPTRCTVKMSAARTVTATFSPVGVAALAVEKKGTGGGTVTSSPAGIDCGATCSAQYEVGKLVKLTATPGAGSKAATWSGCDTVAAGVCEVTVSASKTVTATFEAEPRTLKVKTEGGGSGTVSSLPAGIDCGPTCEASFAAGTPV
ncbi:MAG TPA: PKD domain-containing protein, partial [Solirubrobacterales bacterium]|nr:PKD domain-containing protein [Solirubrobacterales bacterium]